jgi:hypothetical protein
LFHGDLDLGDLTADSVHGVAYILFVHRHRWVEDGRLLPVQLNRSKELALEIRKHCAAENVG